MKTIAFDFDDTIVLDGTDVPTHPKMIQLLKKLKENKDFQLIIETANPDLDRVKQILDKLGIEADLITNTKQSVDIRVDDRTIRYDGDPDKLIKELVSFKHWTRKKD